MFYTKYTIRNQASFLKWESAGSGVAGFTEQLPHLLHLVDIPLTAPHGCCQRPSKVQAATCDQ